MWNTKIVCFDQGGRMKVFDDNVPIYLQVREEIEKAIITGAIAEDEMIPSIRKIAQQYQLNPQTVSNALSELISEEFLYKKRGIGLFVSSGAKERLKKIKQNEFRQVELKSTVIKGKELGVQKNEFIEVIDNVFSNMSNSSQEAGSEV